MGFQIIVTNPCLPDLGRNLAIFLPENCKQKYFTRFLVMRYLPWQFLPFGFGHCLNLPWIVSILESPILFKADIICSLTPDWITVEDALQGNIIYETISLYTEVVWGGSCIIRPVLFLYLLVLNLISWFVFHLPTFARVNYSTLQRIWCLPIIICPLVVICH